ncbi:MAG: glycerophosphodiester phosphodiesterase [Promethearchaeota archaeon]|jgi:glycerophosphoryl diester phosphodiesterase
MGAKILTIAHRGASNLAPENTLKAFKTAIELKADYIEFDVHQSKDGEIVIMHDGNTLRTTGHFGIISRMTLSALKELDCGNGEKIPTLLELIEIAKGKIKLNCEIKARGIAEKIIKIFRNLNVTETTIISSFNHDILVKIQKLDPIIKLASLEPTRTGMISRKKMLNLAIKYNFYAINPFYKLVNLQFVEKAHKNGIKVFPWTVDSISSMKKMVKIGVDGIITNKVSKLKEILYHYE